MSDDSLPPLATYRLQFNQEFRFTDAQALVPYFSRLGVTHAYASPVLRSRQASTHGYDVVDPKMINPNLGDETSFVNLANDLRQFGLGLVLDIVPNHMAASIENPYWRDVLTYGPSSPFARWFDIDWRMPDPEMWGRVLVPVLGDSRSRVLEQDQIQVVWSDGRFLVRYFDHIFPVDPATVPAICEFGFEELKQCVPAEHPVLPAMDEIVRRLKRLPKLAARLQRRVTIDREETEEWLGEFARLVIQSPRIQQWAERTAEQFSQGEKGRLRLKRLLNNQPYRLVHWRDAARTINYRRFFDINELISIRQEDPHVFDETHVAVLRWVNDGLIDGLRIDHVDGLRDPLGYLERLTEALADVAGPRRKVPVFVEKILAPDEKLPCGWPVAGTTGYECLNQLEAVFVSPSGFAEIEQQYRRMMRRPVQFEWIATWGKRRILRNDLSPQVGRLADTLVRLKESSRQKASDGHRNQIAELTETQSPNAAAFATNADGNANAIEGGPAALVAHHEPTKRDFVDAIIEVITALQVYRTYVDSQHCMLNDADRRYVETAVAAARNGGRAAPEAIEFLAEVLLLENKACLSGHDLHERVNFIQRFQQLTGPAAAKGIEDTALYSYVPLVSLNEVGGEPKLPDDPVAKLHDANEQHLTTHPRTMICVTTHDTKRTADVRARLDVLSELPKLWWGLVHRWQELHGEYVSQIGGKSAPDAATEYLIYQTIVGIWPTPDLGNRGQLPDPVMLSALRERLEEYMLKAVREAKTHTSWTNHNDDYEAAVLSFIRELMLPGEDNGRHFLTDVQNLVARIARPGFWNSLSRTLLQYTSPGTPDLYQGDELWNFALVDPDNRRPVDYQTRQQLLDEVITGIEGSEESRREFIRDMVDSPEDARIKLHVVHTALMARREQPDLFATGDYIPLSADGPAKDHIVAFARVGKSSGMAAIIAVPRLTASLHSDSSVPPIGNEAWSDTIIHLPDHLKHRSWRCALTRESIDSSGNALPATEVFRSFPVAFAMSTAN